MLLMINYALGKIWVPQHIHSSEHNNNTKLYSIILIFYFFFYTLRYAYKNIIQDKVFFN